MNLGQLGMGQSRNICELFTWQLKKGFGKMGQMELALTDHLTLWLVFHTLYLS